MFINEKIGSLEVWKEVSTRTPLTTEGMTQRVSHTGRHVCHRCSWGPWPYFPTHHDFLTMSLGLGFPSVCSSTLVLPWPGKPLAAMAAQHPHCRSESLCHEMGLSLEGHTGWTGGNFLLSRVLGNYLKGLAKKHWGLFPSLGPGSGELWGYN